MRPANEPKPLKRLRALRENRKLTQEQMAQMLGVKRSCYAKWERGLRKIPPAAMLRIAMAFGVPAEWLFADLVEPDAVRPIASKVESAS